LKQTVVFAELAQAGLGPKLYGMWATGRLEQYIPSHNITNDEFTSFEVNKVLGRKMAQIHSQDMPIVKNEDLVAIGRGMYQTIYAHRPPAEAFPAGPARDMYQKYYDFNFPEEFEFMIKVCAQIGSPRTFSHSDIENRLNIIVVEDESKTWYDRVHFVDIEYCRFGVRAAEICAHFSNRGTDWQIEDRPPYSGLPYLDETTQREFIRAYITGLTNPDPQTDTEDHIYHECEFFKLGSVMTKLFVTVSFFLKIRPSYLMMIANDVDCYWKWKAEFIEKFGDKYGLK